MICETCWNDLKENLVGKTNQVEQTCTAISRTKKGQIAFGNDFYTIYVSYEEPVRRGKNKGQIQKDESVLLLKTCFCCICGIRHEE